VLAVGYVACYRLVASILHGSTEATRVSFFSKKKVDVELPIFETHRTLLAPTKPVFLVLKHPLNRRLGAMAPWLPLASFRNWSASKSNIRPNLEIVDPVEKLGEEWSKFLSQTEAQGESIRFPISSPF